MAPPPSAVLSCGPGRLARASNLWILATPGYTQPAMRLSLRLMGAVLLLLAPACAQTAAQTPPKPPAAGEAPIKVAEGSYDGMSSWTLWATPKGLKAEIEIHWADEAAKGGTQRETLYLVPDFTMQGFRYETKNFSALPDGALECTKEEKSLECVSTFKGQSGKGSLPFAGAYATQFGVHIAFLDIPWFYCTLLAESDRDSKQPRTFGIVNLAFDGDTPEKLVTGNGSDAEVKHLGAGTVQVLGRPVKGHKFQITAHHYDAVAWTSDSGLLLALDWGGMHIELTRYKQYVELVPELKNAEPQKPPASLPAPADKKPD